MPIIAFPSCRGWKSLMIPRKVRIGHGNFRHHMLFGYLGGIAHQLTILNSQRLCAWTIYQSEDFNGLPNKGWCWPLEELRARQMGLFANWKPGDPNMGYSSALLTWPDTRHPCFTFTLEQMRIDWFWTSANKGMLSDLGKLLLNFVLSDG